MHKSEITPQPVEFMTLYGLDLRMVKHGGVDYVDPRPLCELAGVSWNVFSCELMADDAFLLYETKMLAGQNIPFDERPKGSDKPSPFIRVDRLHVLLIRIDTSKMRWRGKVVQADELLLDQIDWAQELHQIRSVRNEF